MSAQPQPPLWTWAAALLLAAATVALLLVFDARTQTAYLVDQLNLPRLGRAAPPGTPRIVVIGSSRTECAFAYDQDMEARFHRAGRDVRFTRVTLRGAPTQHMALSFDAIVRSHPQLVLVESDLVTLGWEKEADDAPIDETWQLRVREKLRILVGRRRESPNDTTATAPCNLHIMELPVPTPAELAATLAKRRVSSASERQPYLELLDRLRAQGSAIGLVDIPQSPATQRGWAPRLVRDRTQLSDQLAARHGLILLTPGPEPARVYIDRGHLNAEGRERITRWFVTEAIERLGRAHV